MTVIHCPDSNLPDTVTLLAWQHVPDEIEFGMFSLAVLQPQKKSGYFQFTRIDLY